LPAALAKRLVFRNSSRPAPRSPLERGRAVAKAARDTQVVAIELNERGSLPGLRSDWRKTARV